MNATELETWNPELSNGSLPGVGSAICIVFPIGNYTLPCYTTSQCVPQCHCSILHVQSGDGCSSIATAFGLTSNQLLDLNPGLKTDCTNLSLGEAYCVFPTYPALTLALGYHRMLPMERLQTAARSTILSYPVIIVAASRRSLT